MSKFIGSKSFYKMVLLIAVPIMVQNGITNFVSLLDNIMIGQVGTQQLSISLFLCIIYVCSAEYQVLVFLRRSILDRATMRACGRRCVLSFGWRLL